MSETAHSSQLPPAPRGLPNFAPPPSSREHLAQYAAPVGALVVALVALYLLRKPLKRLWGYAKNNKPKVVWWITSLIIALELINPPITASLPFPHVDSIQLLVRIIGISILGFIISHQFE